MFRMNISLMSNAQNIAFTDTVFIYQFLVNIYPSFSPLHKSKTSNKIVFNSVHCPAMHCSTLYIVL